MNIPGNPLLPITFWQDLAAKARLRADAHAHRLRAAMEQPGYDPAMMQIITDNYRTAADLLAYYQSRIDTYEQSTAITLY